MTQVLFDYTNQDAAGASCTAQAWASTPAPLGPGARAEWKARAAAQLKAHDAVLVAHYYVDGDLQDLALATGGCVADSLEMARFGRDHPAQHARRRRRALHGRDGQDPVARQARADARPRRHLLARPRLPGRRVRRLLRRASRSHGRRLCQHQRRGEGARRLDGDELVRAAHRRAPEGAGREDPLGARPPPRPLHPGADRRRHAAVERRLHRARRVQGPRARAAAARASARARAGAPRVAAERDRAGRRGRLDDGAAQGGDRGRREPSTSSPPTTA